MNSFYAKLWGFYGGAVGSLITLWYINQYIVEQIGQSTFMAMLDDWHIRARPLEFAILQRFCSHDDGYARRVILDSYLFQSEAFQGIALTFLFGIYWIAFFCVASLMNSELRKSTDFVQTTLVVSLLMVIGIGGQVVYARGHYDQLAEKLAASNYQVWIGQSYPVNRWQGRPALESLIPEKAVYDKEYPISPDVQIQESSISPQSGSSKYYFMSDDGKLYQLDVRVGKHREMSITKRRCERLPPYLVQQVSSSKHYFCLPQSDFRKHMDFFERFIRYSTHGPFLNGETVIDSIEALPIQDTAVWTQR